MNFFTVNLPLNEYLYYISASPCILVPVNECLMNFVLFTCLLIHIDNLHFNEHSTLIILSNNEYFFPLSRLSINILILSCLLINILLAGLSRGKLNEYLAFFSK